jgi:hypothetical protein
MTVTLAVPEPTTQNVEEVTFLWPFTENVRKLDQELACCLSQMSPSNFHLPR